MARTFASVGGPDGQAPLFIVLSADVRCSLLGCFLEGTWDQGPRSIVQAARVHPGACVKDHARTSCQEAGSATMCALSTKGSSSCIMCARCMELD